MNGWRLWSAAVALAGQSLWRQRLATLILATALASVLAPLLVLFGLKVGVVDRLLNELADDPRNREIVLVGQARLAGDWFVRLAAAPDVGFIAPRTRGAAAVLDLWTADGTRIEHVELLPSAAHDPLLAGQTPLPTGLDTVVLSAALARRLGTDRQVQASVRRKQDGRWERVTLTLRVLAVAPEPAYARQALFVTPELLTAVEDYRDGYAVPALDWPGAAVFSGERQYSGFRLYARSVTDVNALERRLQAEGLQVETQAAAIAEAQQVERQVRRLFWLVAAVGVGGFALAFAAQLWVGIDRQRRELCVLRLLGLSTTALMLYPLTQAAVIALCGSGLALTVFVLISTLINQYFSYLSGQAALCWLSGGQALTAVLLTLGCALAAAAAAAYRAGQLEPAAGLREY